MCSSGFPPSVYRRPATPTNCMMMCTGNPSSAMAPTGEHRIPHCVILYREVLTAEAEVLLLLLLLSLAAQSRSILDTALALEGPGQLQLGRLTGVSGQ